MWTYLYLVKLGSVASWQNTSPGLLNQSKTREFLWFFANRIIGLNSWIYSQKFSWQLLSRSIHLIVYCSTTAEIADKGKRIRQQNRSVMHDDVIHKSVEPVSLALEADTFKLLWCILFVWKLFIEFLKRNKFTKLFKTSDSIQNVDKMYKSHAVV